MIPEVTMTMRISLMAGAKYFDVTTKYGVNESFVFFHEGNILLLHSIHMRL